MDTSGTTFGSSGESSSGKSRSRATRRANQTSFCERILQEHHQFKNDICCRLDALQSGMIYPPFPVPIHQIGQGFNAGQGFSNFANVPFFGMEPHAPAATAGLTVTRSEYTELSDAIKSLSSRISNLESSDAVSNLVGIMEQLSTRLTCIEKLMIAAPLPHFEKIGDAIDAMLGESLSDKPGSKQNDGASQSKSGVEVGCQCPDVPAHVIMHDKFRTESTCEKKVLQSLEGEWTLLQSQEQIVPGSVIKLTKKLWTIDAEDVIPAQLDKDLVGYVGRVEDGDLHTFFPSLTDKIYGWRWLSGRDFYKMVRAVDAASSPLDSHVDVVGRQCDDPK